MAVPYYGDFPTSATVYIPFNTFSSDDPSASVTITNLVNTDVHVHKNGSTTQRNNAAGVTVSVDYDSITGNHLIALDTSDNTVAGFWEAAGEYQVRVEGTTVDGATVNAWVGAFSIERSGGALALLKNATYGLSAIETLVDGIESNTNDLADGERLDLLIDGIKAKTDSLTFTVAGDVDCNVQTWKGAAAPDMTGDAFARLGAPAGASVSADVAAVKSETASILEDTGTTLDGLIKDVPTVAEFEARTIAAADYTVVADLGTVQTGDSFAIVNGASGLVAIDGKVDDILTDTDELQTNQGDWATATGFSTHDAADVKTAIEAAGSSIAQILADTDELQTDDIPSTLAALNDIAVADIWDAASALTLDFGTLLERSYQIVNNRMGVLVADGTVTLRNLGNTATIATGNVATSSGTTTRTELSW